jgi:predicted thioesterase
MTKNSMKLQEGLQYTMHVEVVMVDTALYYGSGELKVLATPALIAVLENAAMLAVTPCLPPEESTVGVEVAFTHSKASPVGEWIEAVATLEKIEGKRLFFRFAASDTQGEIGCGTHTRCIIDKARFMDKLNNH